MTHTEPDLSAPPTSAHARALELELLLACARWPQTNSDRELIRDLLARPMQFDRFLHLVKHHRLVPLVANTLRSAAGTELSPKRQELLDHLGQLASDNTYAALRTLAELRQVLQALAAAGIPVRVLKGIPLAQQIFGDLSLRATGDLDLLIPDSAILEADRVLRQSGYIGLFDVGSFSPSRLRFYRTHWKDIAYENPETRFEVDLHWRCFRNSRMPGGDLCSATGEAAAAFGSFEVPTLPRTETLLYLCVHGTLDGWAYLKSLADVGACVRPMSEDELDTLAERAREYKILPELSAALHLVRQYFGMAQWSNALLTEQDPTVAHILRFSRRTLERGEYLAGRDAISTRSMMAFEIGLRRNLRYRMELMLRVLFRARMWQTIPLPDALFWLYPLLSPFEWIVFHIRQRRLPKAAPGTNP